MIWIIKSFLEGQEDSFCKWSGSSDPFWRDRMIDWIQYLFLQRVYIIIIKPSSLMQQGYIFCKSLINFGRRFDYENDGDCNNCHHHFWSSLSQHRPWWKVAANASDCVGQNVAQPLEVEDHEGQTHLGREWWWWWWWSECDILSRNFSVSRLFSIFWEYRSRSRKKVSVSVSKIFSLEKKSRYQSRKYLVSKKSLSIGLENIWSQDKVSVSVSKI